MFFSTTPALAQSLPSQSLPSLDLDAPPHHIAPFNREDQADEDRLDGENSGSSSDNHFDPKKLGPVFRGGIQQQQVLNPKLLPSAKIQANNEPGIVGIDLQIRVNQFPLLQRVFPNTPAAKAGLKPGDVVSKINGQSTKTLDIVTIDRLIPDRPGSLVKFEVQRQGKPLEIPITVAPKSSLPGTVQQLFPGIYVSPLGGIYPYTP
ncbi:MAG: PDZ domain-containing protein [Cyanobacteria bacterium]|nr:PDZ domain-containing protein [Cyanobacteriota bacterium]